MMFFYHPQTVSLSTLDDVEYRHVYSTNSRFHSVYRAARKMRRTIAREMAEGAKQREKRRCRYRIHIACLRFLPVGNRGHFQFPTLSVNTTELNQARQDLDAMDEIWVFAYGSLLFKIDFPVLDIQNAYIDGWQRRFWQGSHDHRGTPDAPGRVLSLVAAKDARCFGRALRVNSSVFGHLDYREKNGYLRNLWPLHFADGRQIEGIIYVADEHNEAWLGPAPETEIAAHIARSHGPSGDNAEYLLKLADALRELQVEDGHIFRLESLLLSRL